MSAYTGGQDTPQQPITGAAPAADDAYVHVPDPNLAAYAPAFLDAVDELPTYRPTVGCVIPAYNEGDTISGVLDSLLQQTRLPDTVHVIINNTTDDSVEVASHYAGPHTRMTPSGEQSTVIYVHDIGK
ncbi:MAG: glycosyltransferase, partial [Nocardioides sp.]|nr:glycosyltransferase [Nocardioides sp.]